MWTDQIVEETRKVREAYAAQFNYDLEAIYHHIKQQEQHSGHELVTLPAKRPRQRPAAEEKTEAPA
jgi:hypothetical protein